MCPRNSLFTMWPVLDRLVDTLEIHYLQNAFMIMVYIYLACPSSTNISKNRSPRKNPPIILIKPPRLLPPRNPNIQKPPILLRRRIPRHINNRIRTGIRRQISARTAHVRL